VSNILEQKAELLGSLLLFTKVFYKLRTGRDFVISDPTARESHHITISRALTKCFRGEAELKDLIINVPPRYGKTELLIHFIAWTLARYPDSNFLYISYSHSLAKKQTQTIRQIVSLPLFRQLFGVELSQETSAKDNFETTAGGSVYAAGAGGTITGRGAGIQNCTRFGGAIVIDDIHKPSEVTSDTMRETVKDWYYNTLQSRINNPRTPIIFIGQRLHEDDLAAQLIETQEYETVILAALDKANNALHPTMHDKESLFRMEKESPYEFASQYQQNPQPAGGGIFKPEWFVLMEHQPEILATFITADTAETDKNYNDASVFSFWGIYKIENAGIETDLYGLHWIDCHEFHVEPKDLYAEFMDFYAGCMRFSVKPNLVAIEKKSTGVTLLSVLKDVRGLRILDIERTKASGNKTARFLEIQPYVAAKYVSLPQYGKHTEKCLEHCRKITANDSHRFDDIADTLYDAVKIALIDRLLVTATQPQQNNILAIKKIAQQQKTLKQLRLKAYGCR
jgi:predicted phage terminase large subunit-like protein